MHTKIKTISLLNRGIIMKELLLGLFAFASVSSFASELTQKCNVYQRVSEAGYTRYEKIDTLDLGKRGSEFGRPVKGLDNVGLRIRSGGKGTLNVFLIEGHDFTFPTQVFADMSADISQRPLGIRLPVKSEMLSLNCGEIE